MPKKPKEKNTSKSKKTKESPTKQKEKPILKPKETSKKIKKLTAYNINPLQSNETIVKSILDRIITVSVRTANVDIISSQLNDYYFDYLKFQINTMFSTNNIFYSDEPENPNIDNSHFWKTDYNKANTWVEIVEPNTIKCDRFEAGFINYVNIPKTLTVENKQNIFPLKKEEKNSSKKKDNNSNNNKKSNIIKRFSISLKNIKNNKNDLDVLEEKSSRESGDEENKTHTKNDAKKNIFGNTLKKSINNNKSQSLQKDNFNATDNKSLFQSNKRPKNEVLEMANKEIPGINEEYDFEKYDPPNIKFLRREREDQLLRREKEAKNIHYAIKNNNSTLNIIENDEKRKEFIKVKMFDSNRLTFDSNGKIISFKPLKIDFFSKDFNSPKNSVRILKKRKNTIKKAKKTLDEINEAIKEREKEKEKNDATNIENVIKNPIDDIEGINRNQYMKYIMEKNEKIVPSGSNFSIMLPNIGVVLKENEQIKQGNREFGKFFKKYSLEDYDKILKDYVPLQNRTMMINKMGKVVKTLINRTVSKKYSNKVNNKSNISNTINNNEGKNLSSYQSINNNINNNNNYSTIINNNSDISNPLINQENETKSRGNDNINNINQNYNLIKTLKTNRNLLNNPLLSSFNNYNSNLSVGLNNKNNSFVNSPKYEGSIILNKNDITSLKMELDSLQDLDYKNINNYYSPSRTGMKNINLFGRNYRDIFKNIIKNKNNSKDLNEFNKNIITNRGWGNRTMSKNMSSENLLFGKHQTKYQAIREIGNKILNNIKVKLPRSRKINIQI